MNTENFDIDEMRKTWMEMGKTLGMQTVADSNPKDLDRKKTALDRLRERYLTFSAISFVMMFATFMVFSRGIFEVSHLRFWLGVSFAVYFLTASCMDFWLWNGIGTIDPLRMSVSEVTDKSLFYRKRHLQFMTILIPMVIALLGFTGYVFSFETYFVGGMILGVILGTIIGVCQFRRFMSEYRELSE